MPIREYKCKKCGVIEYIHLHINDRLQQCPTCSGSLELLLSASNLQFNGSGFYKTDYCNLKKNDKKTD